MHTPNYGEYGLLGPKEPLCAYCHAKFHFEQAFARGYFQLAHILLAAMYNAKFHPQQLLDFQQPALKDAA